MRVALWLVPGITLVTTLVVGAAGFLFLLLGLNGVSEAKGGQLLTAYAVILLITAIFSAWASNWMQQSLAARTDWSPWLAGPLSIVGAAALASVILIVASVIILFFAAS